MGIRNPRDENRRILSCPSLLDHCPPKDPMAARKEMIVVIDDTDLVRRVVTRLLERAGFSVAEATDGVDGLRAIRELTPALVLCDLRMPRLDGLELLRQVREQQPDLPVIVMSGEGLLDDAIGALRLGAWDYITKPIEPLSLQHAIDKALERASLIAENRRYRARLELLNRELSASLRLLAEDEHAGRQIQFRMLPKNDLCFGPYRVTRMLIPSAFLSGDFIDAFSIDANRFGFYLADVSGHGVSSALVTVLLRTFVQRQVASYVRSGDDLVLSPGRLLTRLNEEMSRDDLSKHLTVFYGIIDLSDDTLLFANAGHFPWPLLTNRQGSTTLEHPGVPVGMMPTTHYQEHQLTLPNPCSLSIVSDGVLEVFKEGGLGEKLSRLREHLGKLGLDIETLREPLSLTTRTTFPDDIAILVVQRGGEHG